MSLSLAAVTLLRKSFWRGTAFNSEDMKGVSIMKVEGMVKVAVKGMQADRFEIRPGQANQLKMMSRVAPGFILKQMSRSVDRMLRTQN